MPREELIRIYRSDAAGATPSGLTSGEIAANLVDGKFFIGGTNGSLITFYSGVGVTGITTGSLGYGQSGTNGLHLNGTTGGIVIQNTGVRALTVQGYGAITSPEWYQKGPQIRGGVGLSAVAGWDDTLTYIGPFIQFSNQGIITVNGVFYNEAGGNVNLTGDGGAVQGKANTLFTARLATTGATGVASFNNIDFVMGSTGHVSLTGTVAKTNRVQTFTALQSFNAGISAATGSSIGGIVFSTTGGSQSFRIVQFPSNNGSDPIINFFLPGSNGFQNYGEFVFGLTANIYSGIEGRGLFKIAPNFVDFNVPAFFHKGANFVASEPPTVPTEGNIVIQSVDDYVGGPYPVLRIVGSVADGIYLSIDSLGGLSSASGAAFGKDVTVKGVLNAVGGLIASNVVNSINSLTGAITLTGDGGSQLVRGNNVFTNRIATSSATGVARFDSRYFKVSNGLVTLLAQPFAQDYPSGPILPFGGIGATADGDGNLNAIYFDPGNLTSGGAIDPDNDTVIYFDASETGLVKTKKRAAKDLILDNSTLFASSKSQLIASKKGTTIDYDLVLGTIADGNDGLILGNDVYQYFKDSSNLVWTVNGCGGAVSITGTVNEIVVTKACPTITIGLPDNVSIPFLSGTGATFTQTVTANRFVGTISGGGF